MNFSNKSEKRRFIFFEIGLILALFAVLTAFEWKSHSITIEDIDGMVIKIEDELPPVTEQQPKPPQQKKEITQTILDIVSNEINVDPDLEFEDISQETPVMKYYAPEKPIDVATDIEPVPFIKIEKNLNFPGERKPFRST